MINWVLNKIIGSVNERELRKLAPTVAEVGALEPEIAKLSDAQLRAKTDELKKRLADGETVDDLLAEAFAVVREAGKRFTRMRHFDVQLIGGLVLHRGKIAEMATGEGKTLVATLSAYLNALEGKGVHVVTVNDYLARRDREWMGPIYENLGLTVGAIQHDMDQEARKAAYACDITYGTNNEFGFDYLRDNMVIRAEEMVQRGHHYAIVDEVDSILVDEARTPLIISGPAEESTELYYKIDKVVPRLVKATDYDVDEKHQTVALTEEGIQKAEELLGVGNLYEDRNIEVVHHVNQALRAHNLFKRDVDYMVKDGQVVIVDEFTGRLMPGRRWSDGLHQAIEAKEGVRIERENQTLATITFQNYFRMYKKLAGMTGTASTEAEEFHKIYKLDVVVIPTNRPLVRTNFSDIVLRTEREKFDAVVEEIAELYQKGRPVLVGTISIEKSERLSHLLKRRGIPHNVLNAKYHEQEAHIVAQAGRFQAVTIATNMAGRGTDIVLGGNAEFRARDLLAQQGRDPHDVGKEEFDALLQKIRQEVEQEHEKVVAVGGLHVLGTERHEARRVDNQLRGRSGRQGDPGSSRFYVSLDDDLMRIFGSDRISAIMGRFGMQEGEAIEHPWVSRAIETAQKRVEMHNFEIRKHLLDYDNVMNRQREIIYGERRLVLDGADLKSHIFEMADEILAQSLEIYCPKKIHPDEWDFSGLAEWVGARFPVAISDLKDSAGSWKELEEEIQKRVRRAYEEKERTLSSEVMRHLERVILLQTIDTKWKDHLYAMDHLREGIGLRAYGQQDPLVAYTTEGFAMVEAMIHAIKEESVEFLFKVQAARAPEAPMSVFQRVPQNLLHPEVERFHMPEVPEPEGMGGAPGMGGGPFEPQEALPPRGKPQPFHREMPKVGRNDPCPCGKKDGEGKPVKYKKCHGV